MAGKATTINSVDRALHLIELLFRNSCEMGISEIAKEMKEYKSTIHRTLATLETHGFVVQNPESEKYGLGSKLYAIGVAADVRFIMRETVRPFAECLREEFQETVNVAAVDSYSDKFCFLTIYRAEGKNQILRMNTLASSNSEPHCSSLGKALLAFTPNFEHIAREMSLRYHTPNTFTDLSAFIKNLKSVQENGYAMDDEELEMGLTCIGVPVFDEAGRVILAISISGPTSRIHNQVDDIIAKLKRAALQISDKLR